MSYERINIGIGFVTGRKIFKKLAQTYVSNWAEHGLVKDKKVSLNLFVAYDLNYSKTRLIDYQIEDEAIHQAIDSCYLIGQSAISEEIKYLTGKGIISERESLLLFGDGYGKSRNMVTYFALKSGIDYLLFIDDDEYPVATAKNETGKLVWSGQDVLSTHLRHIAAVDITHGYHCGYISPIPYLKYNEVLTEDVFRMFIEAISNDIIGWDAVSQKLKDGGITYADINTLQQPFATEVPEVRGCKFISGSNLCLNLNNLDNIPPFYNPPGARGEDTFLSTCLSHLKVLKVPCYTFHDGFLNYTHLLNGALPHRLKPVSVDSGHVVPRFLKASIGWVRYKPLLLYITQKKEYDDEIAMMRTKLNNTIPQICKYFGTDKFNSLYHELEFYHKNVRKHYEEFTETKEAWKKLVEFTMEELAKQAV